MEAPIDFNEYLNLRQQVKIAREVLDDWHKWSLVIESAVRHDAPRDLLSIVGVIKRSMDALKLMDHPDAG